ncbi:MAG: RNA polymerase sigma factor [Bradymonadia bacterium]
MSIDMTESVQALDPFTRELLIARDESVNAATQLIWHRFRRWLGSMATRRVAGDGDDLVQDVMERVVHELPAYDGEPPVYEWLRRMLRDRAKNDRRRTQRRSSLLDEQAEAARESLFRERFPSPEARTAARQKIALLNEAIAALPELDREIFERRITLQQHPDVIGPAVGLNPSAVSVRVTRIKARLAEAIQRRERAQLKVIK